MFLDIFALFSILIALSCVTKCQQEAKPKLVCYYTNWAKDRPDPWSYVSVKPAIYKQLSYLLRLYIEN